MKKILSILLIAVAIVVTGFTNPALADGASTFAGKCAACHIGGGNILNPAKTLSLADLTANGKASVDAIITQVTNGAAGPPAMPAFGGILSDEEIAAVAAYVLEQAEAGW